MEVLTFLSFCCRMWKGVNVPASVIQIYPKMYAIDTITTQPLEDNPELYPAPEIVRLSIDRCENEGIYLVETGHSLILWIGTNVNQQVLKGLFNTQYLESIDVTMVRRTLSLIFWGGVITFFLLLFFFFFFSL